MGHKVDISEVIELSEDVNSSTADIKTSLNSISESIDRLNSLESFSGKTATNAKNYFNDLHKTILITFEHLFTDLDDSLKKHLEMFQSRVDTSESAIIVSDYVKDLELDIKEEWEKLSLEQDKVRETMNSVSDITSAIHPNYYPPEADKDDVIKIITNLEQELNSFTSVGQEEISSIEDLLNQVATTIENAGTVEGEGRFTDYIGTSTTLGLSYLKDYNAEKREVMLDEARKAKDTTLKDMDEPEQYLLNNAFTDLENGKIDKGQYDKIISILKKTKGELTEEELNQEIPTEVHDYLINNIAQITRDLGVPIGASLLEHKGTSKIGAIIQGINSIKGPAGSNSFILVDKDAANAAKPFFKADGVVRKVGSAISKGFIGVGFGIGMYNDWFVQDKTFGESLVRNGVATGIGVGTTVGVTKGLTVAFALGSNPVGWGVIGVAAAATVVGVLATNTFNFFYENNILKFQDGLDWAGRQIDEGLKAVKEAGTNLVGNIGEAFTSGLDAINPFS